MRSRSLWLVLVVLLVPTTASAHGHNADYFGAFSFAWASTLRGFHQQLGITTPQPDNRNLSLVFDLSLHHGEHERADLTRIGVMGGVRWMFDGLHDQHIPSVHAVAGIMHDAGLAGINTEPALAIGGAWEYLPRGEATGWGVRFLADYVFSGDIESFPRVSGGVVYRFGR